MTPPRADVYDAQGLRFAEGWKPDESLNVRAAKALRRCAIATLTRAARVLRKQAYAYPAELLEAEIIAIRSRKRS